MARLGYKIVDKCVDVVSEQSRLQHNLFMRTTSSNHLLQQLYRHTTIAQVIRQYKFIFLLYVPAFKCLGCGAAATNDEVTWCCDCNACNSCVLLAVVK